MKTDNQKINKTKQAYHLISQRIVEGRYVPGQRIILDQIAKEMGSSHIPVREAIRQLEADQWVEHIPNVGAVVRTIDETIYQETLEVLALNEGYATALAASYLTEEDLLLLEETNNNMKRALESYNLQELGHLNKSFHYAIYQACPNTSLRKNIEFAWERLDTVRDSGFSFFPMRAPQSVAEHTTLIEMLRSNSSFEQIERFAREHKLGTLRSYQQRDN
ncbi:GntR family transcriptional regulator [Salsuginibacillus kocurii]|uniref:GntR family transcriptional regulator n=1 Tax=Salsuginibacillus kocurii TaxID=427078 RepID=UPI000377920D|nr:GntR family transcriptional regulator [Salsuginibacillus kocurii]